jgi:uncharacterized SAM-binding protein YcdF (DUF218 family)
VLIKVNSQKFIVRAEYVMLYFIVDFKRIISIAAAQCIWFGSRILRMNEERSPKKILNTKVNIKCPRGRPRLRLEQVIKLVTQKERKQ